MRSPSGHRRVLWDPKGCIIPAPSLHLDHNQGLGVRKTWVQVLAVSFPSCVNVGNFPGPQGLPVAPLLLQALCGLNNAELGLKREFLCI